jgi:hypothetical protein
LFSNYESFVYTCYFYGSLYNYTAGGVFVGTSFKCYNEADPNEEKRFGLHGPDFKEETSTAASITGIIADNSAKHHSSFGLSMMAGMTGGLSGYIARIDTLLNWCDLNQIPTLTFNQWANILYDSMPNPFVNIFPRLQQDLNKNGIPDGYSSPFSTFDTTDGVVLSQNKSYSKNSNGTMTSVQNLGGLEKGNNLFYLSTKGFSGDSVRVSISYPELGSTSTQWMVPAGTTSWNEYVYPLTVPSNVSRMSFTFSAVKRSVPGNIKISGMQLFATGLSKKAVAPSNPTSEHIGSIKDQPEFVVYPNPFDQKIWVSGLAEEIITSVEIMDMYGNKHATKINKEEGYLEFEQTIQSPGLYFIYLKTKDESRILKLIKQ